MVNSYGLPECLDWVERESGWHERTVEIDDSGKLTPRGKVAMIIVEHHAETVLPLVDRAYVLVNGQVAFEGTAKSLEDDPALQARLLGVVQKEAA